MFLTCWRNFCLLLMENFEERIEKELGVYSLPKETLDSIRSITEFKKFKKKEILIREGEYQSKFFFLASGIARAYVVSDNGKEFTRLLYKGPTEIAAIRALTTNEVSFANVDCLTKCEVFFGDFNEFMNLTKKNIDISNIYARMLEKSLLRLEDRVHELSLTAIEKYKLLQKQIPEIDNLIPQYQIASYLNITNVQLSRIRSKMLKS